jgi:hypothetical protein
MQCTVDVGIEPTRYQQYAMQRSHSKQQHCNTEFHTTELYMVMSPISIWCSIVVCG